MRRPLDMVKVMGAAMAAVGLVCMAAGAFLGTGPAAAGALFASVGAWLWFDD